MVYLKLTRTQKLVIEGETFGPAVVNSVMNGGDSIMVKQGMSLIEEVLKEH